MKEKTKNLKGKYALITGASSGLGWSMAKILGKMDCNMVLVARREEKLIELKNLIKKKNNINIHIIPIDLSALDAPQKLYEIIKIKNIQVDILINNAGFGIFGNFIDSEWEKEKDMINLLVLNLTHLTKLFARDMIKKSYGYILNVSSIGAFQPTPLYATYAAAKSYVFNFSMALNYELNQSKPNVNVSVLCPGNTETEFHDVAGQKNKTLLYKLTKMTGDECAAIGIKGMLKRKSYIDVGFINAVNSFFMRLLPRNLATKIAYKSNK